MVDEAQLELLETDVEAWNEWRRQNIDVQVRLSGANLSDADLSGALLIGAFLRGADLSGADLSGAALDDADLGHANLSGADLSGADLVRADLQQADLSGANLEFAGLADALLLGADLRSVEANDAFFMGANLSEADLRGANLARADLTGANLSGADLSGADCTECAVFGISAWKLTLDGTIQKDLVISEQGEPVITVDHLEVAQFVYLLLNNRKIRDVIDTVTSKAVLILGRFADPQRKAVLDGLRDKLRDFDLLPIVFDFDRPTDKDYTETVQTLAGMSMFVIADITNPKSTPLELEATIKQFKIPYVPIIDSSVDPRPFAMLVDSQKSFHWVLPTLAYTSAEELLDDDNLKEYIVDRALAKRAELRTAKSEEPEMLTIARKDR